VREINQDNVVGAMGLVKAYGSVIVQSRIHLAASLLKGNAVQVLQASAKD